MSTYTIELWDHEPDGDDADLSVVGCDSTEGRWSGELARIHLDGDNSGLGPAALREALRKLREQWSDEVIMVSREHDKQLSLFGSTE